MFYGSLAGRGVWGEVDTRVCMAESVCCSPETITALLIGFSNIKLKKEISEKDPIQRDTGLNFNVFLKNSPAWAWTKSSSPWPAPGGVV